MALAQRTLPLREEPVELRAETRALLEESPEDGSRLVGEASFVADLLWADWGALLGPPGIPYDGFIRTSRG